MSAILVMLAYLVFTGPALATVISFQDTQNYWPNWGNGTSDDGKDTIGIPNITGGSVDVENGLLNSVTFNYTGCTSSLWHLVTAGDLFVDINANGTWDWVIRESSVKPFGSTYLDKTAYLITDPNSWSGYDIRDDHPWAWAGDGAYTGFDLPTTGSYTFTGFSSTINVGDNPFIIGWTVNCANDVVYE